MKGKKITDLFKIKTLIKGNCNARQNKDMEL